MLTERQVPYTGPYGLATSGLTSKGPTAEALKRAMSRMGFLPWNDFDQHFNRPLADALGKWDPGKTGYGPGRWQKIRAARVPIGLPHEGEYALDQYSRWLIQAEAGETAGGDDEELVQAALVEWGYGIVRNAARIGYSQARPVDVTKEPGDTFNSDCSATIIQGFHYARRKTGLRVPDPSKQGYSGYGNTDLYEDDHPKVGAPFRVGDLAHFHSPRHVIMCVKAGGVSSAEWVSHGKASDPQILTLAGYSRYPEEYLFAVRPPLVEGV